MVLTVTVVPEAAITKEPAEAEPQTAGEAAEEQFVAVTYAFDATVPEKLPEEAEMLSKVTD